MFTVIDKTGRKAFAADGESASQLMAGYATSVNTPDSFIARALDSLDVNSF